MEPTGLEPVTSCLPAALSQLSYGPLLGSQSSREVEVVRPIYSTALVFRSRRRRASEGASSMMGEEAAVEVA